MTFPTDALLHGAASSPSFTVNADRFEIKDDVRSSYRSLTSEEKFQIASIKDIGQELIDLIDTMPMSREFALAKTKVEEAVMWATKGVTK